MVGAGRDGGGVSVSFRLVGAIVELTGGSPALGIGVEEGESVKVGGIVSVGVAEGESVIVGGIVSVSTVGDSVIVAVGSKLGTSVVGAGDTG